MTAVCQRPVHRLGLAEAGDGAVVRPLVVEAPVAIEYGGIGYAVMMATPADLEAYAVGFTLSEGLAADITDILAIDIHAADGGWVVRIALAADCMAPVLERARRRVSESSCGLCGMDSIAQVLRPLPPVGARLAVPRAAIARALRELPDHQPLGRETGAAHAAAFCAPDGAILHCCEDVGRHNALDKLIGTLAMRGVDPAQGFMLLSARCSYELVEKTVRAGCPLLVTISAPTSLAAERAAAAGLTLLSLARADSALIVSDPYANLA